MFHFPFYIAKRYLISRKKLNAINIISGISIVGVAFGSMAFIIILSVFNGLDGLVKSLFNSFDPDLKITLVEGKTFSPENEAFKSIQTHPKVIGFAQVIEENALFQYGDRQQIGIIKGVSENYPQMSGIDSMLIGGSFTLKHEKENLAVIGQGIAIYLSVGLNFIEPIKVWVPRRLKSVSVLNASDAFNEQMIYPSGIFSIQPEFDSKYIITPIDFARDILEYTTEVSALEIKLSDELNQNEKDDLRTEFQLVVGEKYKVMNRYQQHEFLYKIMKSEKFAIFLILTFILAVASFNMVASITMLLIDKQKDIAVLVSMGAGKATIRNIFFYEGWLITIVGALIGLILGATICYIQQTFGIIQFPVSDSILLNAYPVDMQWTDFVTVFLIVAAIGLVASWFPVIYSLKKNFSSTNNVSVYLN